MRFRWREIWFQHDRTARPVKSASIGDAVLKFLRSFFPEDNIPGEPHAHLTLDLFKDK